jgi:hypothetical protein
MRVLSFRSGAAEASDRHGMLPDDFRSPRCLKTSGTNHAVTRLHMPEGDRIRNLTSFMSLSNTWTLHLLPHSQTFRYHRSTYGEGNYTNASSLHGGVLLCFSSRLWRPKRSIKATTFLHNNQHSALIHQFILRFALHVSGSHTAHHQEVTCTIWQMVIVSVNVDSLLARMERNYNCRLSIGQDGAEL